MLYAQWLKLPINTRHEMARIFKIPKTGSTEVSNNEVVKDGYNIHDIESAITIESLQYYLGSIQENFQYLWEDMVATVEGKPLEIRETFTAATEEEPITTTEVPVTVPNASFVGVVPPSLEPDVEQPKPKNKGGRPKKSRA